ncbi:3-keto-steroid reductase [Sugiyamaella lignohabitans]|uniref:3beta-hydroxysteroid 3-dehydrogenase n=1 Tax=Sugiyamaella lignohabitans TaxID=796027 RepID=A0A167DTW4_9ASCO|nr:3-keto-steroid reductase [Sugiyamaella lignohabitans]ANB13285.1 3-keto-steroid reductase [Sugiyamaella lignohabitans]
MLGAARDIKQRYKHIDYLFLNSSHSQLERIDYVQATKDFFTQPIKAFTVGTFKVQGISKTSLDGFASVFQANVLSPWYLINEIIPVLKDGGRIIWISTSIALPEMLSEDDLGLVKCKYSYEASKYEIELLQHATYQSLYNKYGIQSWLLHPGVFKSTTFVPTLNVFAYVGMFLMFYICRLFGSKYHCIYPEVAANAPVWAAVGSDPEKDDMSLKYGSATDRWGNEVLERAKLQVVPGLSEKIYEYVERQRKELQSRLKDQVVERYLY